MKFRTLFRANPRALSGYGIITNLRSFISVSNTGLPYEKQSLDHKLVVNYSDKQLRTGLTAIRLFTRSLSNAKIPFSSLLLFPGVGKMRSRTDSKAEFEACVMAFKALVNEKFIFVF